MELNYKGSFLRDLDNISNKYLLIAVSKKIQEIKSANSTAQISRLKRFKAYTDIWYKIEIRSENNNKIYWILCTIKNNLLELRRIKPEIYFKKHY